MDNRISTNRARRYKAHISILGTTQIHKRNPYIIAWWSAALPGFGHILLSKYLRGFILFIWEIVINTNANVNLAMVYSFCGEFEMAKQVLEPRWMLLYISVYIFAIWDSYRTCVDLNKIYTLAEHENADFNSFSIGGLGINYLDKRSPIMAVIWSFMMPGTGQLYIHRVIGGVFSLVWIIVMIYYSRFLEAIYYLFFGEIDYATSLLNPEWYLFMPSLWGFSVYDAYMNTVENNKLYEQEQTKYLSEHYQKRRVKMHY
jgi:TM2 domain-containing membrane protein YozV